MKALALTLLLSTAMCGQWTTGFYSAQNGVMPVANIPWSKYTHIIHFAAAPAASGNGTVSLYYLSQAEINQLIASRPPGTKVLVCIKDNDTNPNAFAQSTSPGTMAAFASNIVQLVESNGYDGVDIDWEQNIRVAQYEDLIARLRNAMPAKVITMAAGNWGGMETVAAASHLALDQINVMCYDMDNGQNCNRQNCTWYNAALYQGGQGDKRTCDWRVRSFTSPGVPSQKIGIGLPFFGRRWVGAALPQVLGTFTAFTVTYRDLVADGTRWQPQYQFYDTSFRSNYLSIPGMNEFISFTGVQSITDAVGWAKAQGFGGFMTFALEYEYLPALMGDASHPLSTALHSQLFDTVARPGSLQLTVAPDSRPRAGARVRTLIGPQKMVAPGCGAAAAAGVCAHD